jgi:predicted nucleic acid-binding protein
VDRFLRIWWATWTGLRNTNVLVYSRDLSEPEKQPQALAWMKHLWSTRTGRTGFQVLQEFYVTVTQTLVPGLDKETAREDVRSLLSWGPTTVDRRIVEGAWTIQDAYTLSWWDALIVSAALAAGCRYLLTEDLKEGQDMESLTVLNPFRTSPSDL